MTEAETEAQFRQLFTRRVKDARESAGMKQLQIAELLGIPRDKYKHYEGRSLLPHYLVGRFFMLCRVDPAWLMTGRVRSLSCPPYDRPLQPAHHEARTRSCAASAAQVEA
jgi:DNA-binding XRE family transcriptional regulator